MTVNELYGIADLNNINVYHFPMEKLVSVSAPDNIGIDVNKIKNTADEAVHLAHELGHCIKGAFYNIFSNCDIREKHEYKADKWAINTLVPFDELMTSVNNGMTEAWDLAEHFNVTEEFIKKAFDIYQRMGKI